MRIIRDKNLQKMLKEAYEKGLNIRCVIYNQTKKMDELCRGGVLPGYDMDKDLEEILKRKGCN